MLILFRASLPHLPLSEQRALPERKPAMLTQIKGLHHVTSMAADAPENNAFFTKTLGLPRAKKPMTCDAADVYPLDCGDA